MSAPDLIARGMASVALRQSRASATPPGWTQIAAIAPTGTALAEFTAIPSGFADLILSLEGVSHDNASNTSLTIALSGDGVTFSTAATIAASAAAVVTWHGAVELCRYTANAGMGKAAIGNLATPPASASVSSNFAWRVNGGIKAVRLAPAAGLFDAGTIGLYGR